MFWMSTEAYSEQSGFWMMFAEVTTAAQWPRNRTKNSEPTYLIKINEKGQLLHWLMIISKLIMLL